MSEQQWSGPDPIGDLRKANAVGLWWCQVWAIAMEVFWHHRIGSRYLDFQAAAVVPLIFGYALFWRDVDLWPLMYFLFAYLGACMLHGVGRWRWLWGPELGHSRYTGTPHLLRFTPWIDEVTFKRWVEPMLTLVIGAAVCAWSPPLGVFLMIGAVALAGSCAECIARDQRRDADMNDAVIEQQWVAERFRGRRGDRF